MREARLVGLSQDGKQLILAMAETGEEFAIPVDDRLRAALRGDRARLGQLEIQMESALRPRDIQARIRAGESVEEVAAVAQMPMERVMAFAGPVLAERDHVASLAQRASVRRRGGAEAPTRNLGAWVTERLRIRGVDPGTAEWDAWRRDDGRWAVRVSYHAGEDDEKIAMFAYDAPGRYAVPDDDEARWLVGEQAQVMPPQPTERRLTAVADIDLSLAPDHGADSYEAGFEDTLNLTRARRDLAARETSGREAGGRDFRGRELSGRDAGGRDAQAGGFVGREAGGSPGRETGAGFAGRDYAGREVGGRDFGREPGAPDFGRESAREGFSRPGGREAGREPGREAGREAFGRRDDLGPRRVQPVPSPDEEPTLIDVPIEPPPSLRPAVRAVERPAQLPAEAASIAPPEERAAAPDSPFTARGPRTPNQPTSPRPADPHPAEAVPTESRPADPRPTEARGTDSRPTEARAADARPADARPADAHPADARTADARAADSDATGPRPMDPRPADKPVEPRPAEAHEPTPAAATPEPTPEQPAPEPKKKPARRSSKRASVPSWDEIMFGKKAD